MFTSIPSLDSILQCLLPVFTQPSFQTHVEVLLGWVMCLRKWTEYGVFQTIRADTPSFSKTAASLRPLLQLLQPIRLDRPRLGPADCRGRGCPARSTWAALSGRGRHAFAQVRQTRLGLGVVPRRRGLDAQADGHRFGQPLGRHGAGDPHSGNQQDLLSADPRQAAPFGKGPARRGGLGQGNARRRAGLVSRAKVRFSRRWGLFGENAVGQAGFSGDVYWRDARRRGHLRSATAEASQGQRGTQAAKGCSPAQPARSRQEGGSSSAGRGLGVRSRRRPMECDAPSRCCRTRRSGPGCWA